MSIFFETIVTTVSLHGENIPLTSSSDNLILSSRQFIADGEDLANYITKLEYKKEYGGEGPKTEILDTYEFTASSSLVLYLYQYK